ncbi:MAG: hypothetical protein ACTSVD_06915 [Candidatus Thorarchaeota archaeon]|nr:MAG: hypothetical protein DRO93_05620 [Candidatus Thorarchaeota archaeon]
MAPSVTEANAAKFENLIRRALRNALVSIDVTGWTEEAVKVLLHVMSTSELPLPSIRCQKRIYSFLALPYGPLVNHLVHSILTGE